MKTKQWKDITLNQFIELKALPTDMESHDRAISVVSIVYNMNIEDVESMPLIDVLELFSKCQFLERLPNSEPTLYANGYDWDKRRRKYKFLYDLRYIKGHHYIELQHILSGGESIDKLPEVMALITIEKVGIPLKLWDKKIKKEDTLSEYEDRVRFFKYHANVEDCYPVMLFFSLLWKKSYDVIQSSLASQMKEAAKVAKSVAQH